MNKTYEITFAETALPGVVAIGGIRRGQSVKVEAAEALRLVRTKGLAFTNAADERSAQQELTGAVVKEPPPLPATDNNAVADSATAISEEH